VEILFEERKKIETKSLAEGNAQNNLIIMHLKTMKERSI
jgi:hypothetical protein